MEAVQAEERATRQNFTAQPQRDEKHSIVPGVACRQQTPHAPVRAQISSAVYII